MNTDTEARLNVIEVLTLTLLYLTCINEY